LDRDETQPPILPPGATPKPFDIMPNMPEGPEFTEEIVEQIKQIVFKHEGLFMKHAFDLGVIRTAEFEIETADALPQKVQRRQVPIKHKEKAREFIGQLHDEGLVRKSCSPWSAPLVCVIQNGKFRMCVDYRKLNKVTKGDTYPIPNAQYVFDSLSKCKYFSAFDLGKAYYQTSIKESDRQKTAFTTGDGHWEWNCTPFGCKNAPSFFQRIIESTLAGHNPTENSLYLAYIDDVLIATSTIEEHMTRMDELFTRLSCAGFKITAGKSHLFQKEVRYLGHILSHEGISPFPEKI
jgi:hypothetical protein